MKIEIKNLRFVTVGGFGTIETDLGEIANKNQIAEKVRKALLKESMMGEVKVK